MPNSEGRLVRTITSTTEPVTLAEVKNRARVTVNTADDALLTGLITSAREMCETYLSRDILPSRYVQTEIRGSGRIDLFNAPISSIQSVVVDGVTLMEK